MIKSSEKDDEIRINEEQDYSLELQLKKNKPYKTKIQLNIQNWYCYVNKQTLRLKRTYKILDVIGSKYACLNTNLDRYVLLDYYDQSQMKERQNKIELLQQIKCLKYLQHNNIISLLDTNYAFQQHKHLYYVTELMDADLKSIISCQEELTDNHIKFIMYQIILALHYLHSAKIIYSDLKPSYILLNQNCDIKLYQFKYARSFLNKQRDTEEQECAKFYRAPEINFKDEFCSKSDIWSAGCIFSELHNRKPLFYSHNSLQLLEKQIQFCKPLNKEEKKLISSCWLLRIINKYESIKREPLSQKIINANPLALDLIDKMLQFFPENRFDALQCLKHPYFEDLFDEDDLVIMEEEFDWTFLEKCKDFQDYQLDQLLYIEFVFQ